jgi:hypothetical protein
MKIGDWEIKSRAEHCAVSGKAFREDEEFMSVLFQGEEGLERMDMSLVAWKEWEADETEPLSCWKSRFQPGPEPESETVDKQDAESELRRLLDQGAPESAKLCRLLALLLERKRILKLREKIDQPDRQLLVFEHTDTQESFLVPDVDFKLSDLDTLRDEIMEKSGSRLFSLPVESPPPAETETAQA